MQNPNDPRYAHYPHINNNKQKDQNKEKTTSPSPLDASDKPNNDPKKKAWLYITITIITVLTIIAAALVVPKLFLKHDPTTETIYQNIDDVKFFQNYVINDEDDADGDGLTNGEEKYMGTNYNSFDTDKDGLSDADEVNKHKTAPLKSDTDGDTIDDGTEIALGLNPLDKNTDGTPDKEKTFELNYKLDEGSLRVNGRANIANIYAQKVDSFKKNNNPGVVSDMYEFYLEGTMFDTATLQLSYDQSLFSGSQAYVETDLSIFQYMNDGTYKLVESEVDVENNTVTAQLEHFSKYCIAAKPIVQSKAHSKVFIVLDNSGSMYPKELCETSDENDVDFKRVDFAKQLIEAADDKEIKFGLAKFTADYTELCPGFGNNKDDLYSQLDAIKTTEENFNGTHIAKAIISACANFSKDDIGHRKFIILLTDGATTEGQGFGGIFDNNEDDAIRAANEKNVSVIVVGLGANVDSEYCNKIAQSTNGAFVYANNSSALHDVHFTIRTMINNMLIDLDNNGEMDHILIADSGFDINKNAFSFNNYWFKSPYQDAEIGGQCHGMAVFAQRYYLGTLPQTNDHIDRYKSALFGDYLEGMPYDLSEVGFFGNGNNHYTLSKKNLKDYVLFPELEKYNTGNIWDKYLNSVSTPYYLAFTPKLKEYIRQHPLLVLHEKNDVGSVVTGKNKANGDEYKYRYYDSYSFTTDVDYDTLSDENKEIYQVLAALNNLWAGQCKDWWHVEQSFSDDGYDQIVDWVNAGIAPVCGGEGHATNLTQIYRDVDNPLKYTLVIYDNNNCKEYKTLALTKTKYNKVALNFTAWTNDYKFEIYDTDGVYGKQGQEIDVDFSVYVKP